MPTATTVSLYSLTNWGPLTTVFPADPCETGCTHLVCVEDSPGLGFSSDCNVPVVDPSCYPSASQVNEIETSAWNTVGRLVMGYFSPGLVCPSGWQTVGVAARGNDGSMSADGIFVAPTPTTTRSEPPSVIFNPAVNAFTGALDPGETAVACCPSSMTAVKDGVCYSILPEYKIMAICERLAPSGLQSTVSTDLTLLGVHITALLETWAKSGAVSKTLMTTLAPSDTQSLIGAKQIPMVMLVKKAGDGWGVAGVEEVVAMEEDCRSRILRALGN